METERASKRMKSSEGGSTSSSPAAPEKESQYQVFLSFSGKDTRKTFTDHLYCYLRDAGISTFRDKDNLHVGKEIRLELLEAIKGSTISIPIISREYGYSKWCLIELTHMLKWREENTGHEVCPIFYDVTPSDVRNQTGSFAEAFLQHAKDFDDHTVQEWREALKEVANLSGWEKDKVASGYEGELVNKVVSEICIRLKKNKVNIADNLVGMDDHVKEMKKLLDINGYGARIIGIIGMGGIGKTTIAKFLYNKIGCHFQGQCSFLENIREKVKQHKGYDGLRHQLILDILRRKPDGISPYSDFRGKKVLIVLDDVEEKSQLSEIIGDQDWFGSGSRIIVTTRNKEVFEGCEEDLIYRPKEMNYDDSMLLFCKYAFKSTYPAEGYEDISRDMVSTAAGLPLCLVVTGSLLFKKEKEEWEVILNELKTIPPNEVQKRLKISYDTLDFRQQQIFLDIACHFVGQDKAYAFYMWHACGFLPERGIRVLINLSLISIKDDNVIRMHDHLRDLGRDIVYEKNPNVGNWSRLWYHEQAAEVVSNQLGTSNIQTVHVDNGSRYQLELYWHPNFDGAQQIWEEGCDNGDGEGISKSKCFSNDDFKGFSGLRYLHLGGSELKGDFKRVLPNLRWFRLRIKDPPTTLTNFCLDNLVILDLSGSGILDGWESWIQIKLAKNLKVLNLSDCRRLKKLDNLSTLSKLERLILKGCWSLTEICPSVMHLKSLAYFNAIDCFRLGKLPVEFGSMVALKEIYLDLDCSLSYYRGTLGITELPDSIGSLEKLRRLSLEGCKSLVDFPVSFWNLKSLVELDLSWVQMTELSEGIGNLTNLRKLLMCHSHILSLPDAIGKLKQLEVLDLKCSKITGLPAAIGMLEKLQTLRLQQCCNLTELPEAIGNWSNSRSPDPNTVRKMLVVGVEKLQKLEVLDCSSSSLRGELPNWIWSLSSLRVLDLRGTGVSGIPTDISGLSSLLTLNLQFCKYLKLPAALKLPFSLVDLTIHLTTASLDAVANLENLTDLCFSSSCFSVQVDNDPSDMSKLEILGIYDVVKMSCPPLKFGSLSQLKYLKIVSCEDLPCLTDLANLQMLRELVIDTCSMMTKIVDFPRLGSLESISILKCPSLEALPNLSNQKNLKKLQIQSCQKLREIKGLNVVTSLESIRISYCTSLDFKGLLNLSNLKGLKSLRTEWHDEISKGLKALTSLEDLALEDCKSQEVLLDLVNLKRLKGFSILRSNTLHGIEGLKVPTSLVELGLEECKYLEGLSDLSNLKKLEKLRIQWCDRLREVRGLEFLTSLKELHLWRCTSLEELSDLSSLKQLERLQIWYCDKLHEIKGLEVLTSLKHLSLQCVPLSQNLPDLSHLKHLRIHVENLVEEESASNEEGSELEECDHW